MRVGIVGDIHAEDVRLDAALRHLRSAGATTLVAVGDLVDGVGDVDRVCWLLAEHGVRTVRGNHERWFLHDRPLTRGPAAGEGSGEVTTAVRPATRDYLAALPVTLALETPVGRALICHGLGENDMRQLRPDDYGYELECNDELNTLLASRDFSLVLCGHTHVRMVKTFRSGNDGHELTVVNAGTLRGGDEPCFALADFDRGSVEFLCVEDPDRITPLETHRLGVKEARS